MEATGPTPPEVDTALLQALTDSARVGFAFYDRDLRYVRINDTLAAVNGLPAAAHIGRRVDEVLPELAPQLTPILAAVRDTGEPRLGVEIDGATPGCPDRRGRWIVDFYPVRDCGSGRMLGVSATVSDVTEQRRAEDAVRRSEARLQEILDNAPVVVYVKDLEGRYRFTNRQGAAIAGRERAEIIGKTDRELFPEEMARRFEEGDRLLLARDAPYSAEERVPHPDGTLHTYVAVSFPLRDADGKPDGLCGISTDITARVQISEALRESRERFKRAFDDAAIGMALVSPEGGFLQVNRSLCEILGYSEEELLSTDFQSITHPDDLEADLASLEQVLTGQRRRYRMEKRFLHKQGHVLWVELSASAVRDADNRALYLIGQVQDITARKDAEVALRASAEELRKSERFARATVDALASCIAILDESGTILAANKAWRDHVERTGAAHGCREGDDYLQACERASGADGLAVTEFADGIRRVMRGETETFSLEYSCPSPDGALWFGGRVTRFPAEGAARVVVAHWNITERKRLQEQVLRHEKLAALGELVAGVAHEINNPLSIIMGNAELLAMHDDPQVCDDARVIQRMGDRAARIVRSLLTFAHGNNDVRRLTTLAALVQESLDICSYKLRKADIALELCLDRAVPPVEVDANGIQQILLNLINNAEHALREQPEKRLRIRTSCQSIHGERWATVAVEDNGCGIPAENLKRIFDPFFTTKDVGEGTGLGLSICHGIAQAHGGMLLVDSAEGAGTTFTLALPLAVPDLPFD